MPASDEARAAGRRNPGPGDVRSFSRLIPGLVLSMFGLALLFGCATVSRPVRRIEVRIRSVNKYLASQDADMSAPEVAALVADALRTASPPIQLVTSKDGKMQTAWFDIAGRTAGILLWRRTWLCHARFTIAILPDYESPTSNCCIEIRSEVEERPNQNYAWQEADSSLADKLEDRLVNIVYSALRQRIRKE